MEIISIYKNARRTINGLINLRQQYRQPMVSMFDRWRGGPQARSNYWKPGMSRGQACECLIPALYCFRTSSQRTLDSPVVFMSSEELILAGNDAWPIVIDDVALGILQGTGVIAGTGEGLPFYVADINAQRASIANMVLWGLRIRVLVWAAEALISTDHPNNLDDWMNAVQTAIGQNLGIEIFHRSDSQEPWVSFSELNYFNRPGEYFIPLPPVLWRDRDPFCRLIDRPADIPSLSGAVVPRLRLDRNMTIQVVIAIEGVWSPSPAECGNMWPGELCLSSEVANTPQYLAKHGR